MEQGQFVLEDLLFEDLLAEAVDTPSDEEAQIALQSYVQEVIFSGDIERTMSMVMVLEATACLHTHVEEVSAFAKELSSSSPDDSERTLRGTLYPSARRASNQARQTSETTRANKQPATSKRPTWTLFSGLGSLSLRIPVLLPFLNNKK